MSLDKLKCVLEMQLLFKLYYYYLYIYLYILKYMYTL